MARFGQNKPTLSKNLLEMKFMQRSKEKVEKRIEEENERNLFHSEKADAQKDRFVTEKSYIFCGNLVFGRMSYRQFNPEIERLMVKSPSKNSPKETDEGLSDEAMAQRYTSLVQTIAKKFDKNNKKSGRCTNKRRLNETPDLQNRKKRNKASDFWKPDED